MVRHTQTLSSFKAAAVVLAISLSTAVVAGCSTPGPNDPEYERLALYVDTPEELSAADRGLLLDKARQKGEDDVWHRAMTAALEVPALIPEAHAARYEQSVLSTVQGGDELTGREVNAFLTYLIKADVERRNDRLLVLYDTAFLGDAYARFNFDRAVYVDALNRLEKRAKLDPESGGVLISAMLNYLRMYADNVDQWQTRYGYGDDEQSQLMWLKDYVLNNDNPPEYARVKDLIRKLEPHLYQQLFAT